MKDMFKFVDKKRMLIVFVVSIIQSVLAYATSFCFSYYATSPLTISKLYSLLITLIIIYIISIIFKIEYDAKNYKKTNYNTIVSFFFIDFLFQGLDHIQCRFEILEQFLL